MPVLALVAVVCIYTPRSFVHVHANASYVPTESVRYVCWSDKACQKTTSRVYKVPKVCDVDTCQQVCVQLGPATRRVRRVVREGCVRVYEGCVPRHTGHCNKSISVSS
jgi:hypothetical protein